jgi:hypothetical protein
VPPRIRIWLTAAMLAVGSEDSKRVASQMRCSATAGIRMIFVQDGGNGLARRGVCKRIRRAVQTFDNRIRSKPIRSIGSRASIPGALKVHAFGQSSCTSRCMQQGVINPNPIQYKNTQGSGGPTPGTPMPRHASRRRTACPHACTLSSRSRSACSCTSWTCPR